MKTKLFTLILILFVLQPEVSGQMKRVKADAGIRFGVLAGGGVHTFIGKNYWGEKLDHKMNLGLHVGTNVILPVFGDLWIQPGMNLIIKGSRQLITTIDNETQKPYNIIKETNLGYLEVPLLILYRPQLGDGHLLLGAGPYGAYGLIGNERTMDKSITTELKVKFLADATGEPAEYVYYRALDAGAAALIGYELYNGLFTQLNGQMGLTKLNSNYGITNDPAIKKNLGLSLSAGFRF